MSEDRTVDSVRGMYGGQCQSTGQWTVSEDCTDTAKCPRTLQVSEAYR